MEFSRQETYHIVLKWAIIFLFLIAFHFLASRFIHARKNSALPEKDIPEGGGEVKIIHVWYEDAKEYHIVLQPYFFSQHQTDFNDRVLNQSLETSGLTYYKLWIINFNSTPITFLDFQSTISLTLEKNGEKSNVPLSSLVEKKNLGSSVFFSAFLSETPLLEGHSKVYLLAFSDAIRNDDIKSVQISLQGKQHALSKLLCLQKDFDEYLQKPMPSFWQTASTKKNKG